MKKFLKFIVAGVLVFLARNVIRRYRPHIVMVTGSVGKTSTKDAVATVLGTRFLVRKSAKSFNSEFGVPFTIFGVENPWRNPFAWLMVLKKAFGLLILPNHYPKMLVLEVGAEQPGDLARILRIATPDAVVVTRLPEIPVHVEAYTSPEAVREEEFSPAYALHAAAPLIISSEDAYAVESSARTPARVISFGSAPEAKVRIAHVEFAEEAGAVTGMRAAFEIAGQHEECVVTGSVGFTQVFPVAAALATAIAFDIEPSEAIHALEAYEPPAGRGRLFAGKHDVVLIDDSYNSSPVAVEEALAMLQAFPHAKRRVAVLGDMLELGRYSVSEHERIAKLAHEAADLIVAVGIRARAFDMKEGKARVLLFNTSQEAAAALSEELEPGDVVLLKGSQSIRIEHIVKALLADPDDASRLVRQSKNWQKKK